jgi:hypothetical protein
MQLDCIVIVDTIDQTLRVVVVDGMGCIALFSGAAVADLSKLHLKAIQCQSMDS